MLESTFFATHSSFMAMIGVAEQFSHLRNYLGQVFSIMAIIRPIRDEIYKLFGMPIPVNPIELTAEGFNKLQTRQSYSSKPFWIFLLFVVGIPWLISKLIQRVHAKRLQEGIQPFHPSQLDFAKALFDFIPESPEELRLSKGQIVAILERTDVNWWRGRSQQGEIGFFPANRVEVIEKTKSKPSTPEPEPTEINVQLK
jgi:peroxin-13